MSGFGPVQGAQPPPSPLRLAERAAYGATLTTSVATLAADDEVLVWDTSAGAAGHATLAAFSAFAGLTGLNDNRLLRANGTTALQDSAVTLDDSGNLTGVVALTMTGTLTGVSATLSGTLSVDTVAEASAGVGVTVDGVLVKDGGVTLTAAAVLEADTIRAVGAGTTVTVDDSLIVTGSLTVNGTPTTIDSVNLVVEDPLIKLAKGNTADTLDLGWYAAYDGGTTEKFAGLFRDASDGKFKFFSGLQAEPTTTVNTGGTGYAAAPVVLGALEATSATLSGDLTLTGGVIADSTGTITLDDDVNAIGSMSLGSGLSGDSLTVNYLLGQAAIITNANALPTSGGRIGFICLGGASANTLRFGLSSYARETWVSGGASASELRFELCALGSSVRTTALTVHTDAAIFASGVDLTLNGATVTDTAGPITLGSNLRLNSGAAAATADAINVDSTNKAFAGFTAGIGGRFGRTLAVGYSDRTQGPGPVTNVTLVPASLKGTLTLPANYLVPGRAIRYYLRGHYTTDAAPGNAEIRVRIGSTTFRTTGSFVPDASVTQGVWELSGCITCQTDGASGTVQGVMEWQHEQALGPGSPWHVEPATSVSAVTIDTTAAQTLDFQWTADDAGTSITCTCFFVEEV